MPKVATGPPEAGRRARRAGSQAAKLAPLVVELPQEAEEDKARRPHAALREMRATVGDAPQIRVEDSKPR